MSKEAIKYITAMLAAFGPDEAISMTKETWAKIHEAMQALAQPEQEPVAYGLFINGELSWDSEWAFSNESFPVQFDDEECRPLYTSPPAQRKPLTDEQIMEMYNEPRSDAEMIEFARAIEAAHGIKE